MKVTTATLSKQVKKLDPSRTIFHWTEAVEASDGAVENVWMITADSTVYSVLNELFTQLKLEVADATFHASGRVVFEVIRRRS
jgi:hypothetical protein